MMSDVCDMWVNPWTHQARCRRRNWVMPRLALYSSMIERIIHRRDMPIGLLAKRIRSRRRLAILRCKQFRNAPFIRLRGAMIRR